MQIGGKRDNEKQGSKDSEQGVGTEVKFTIGTGEFRCIDLKDCEEGKWKIHLREGVHQFLISKKRSEKT